MDAQQTIATYERILAIADAMLAAAQAGDWDYVSLLEGNCQSAVRSLAALGDDMPRLTPVLHERKQQIVRQVLADDAEIRRLAEPKLAELEYLIGHTSNQRRLLHSYGA